MRKKEIVSVRVSKLIFELLEGVRGPGESRSEFIRKAICEYCLRRGQAYLQEKKEKKKCIKWVT
jgi:metal-responsive CopG/Arc/MetJ family transcriptional regulator